MDNPSNTNSSTTTNISNVSSVNTSSKLILINGKDKRALLLAELEKWNSAEQIKFVADSMKFFSFSLIKFVSAICNDLIEKQSISKTSRLNSSNTSSLNDFSSSSTDTSNTQHYSNILEEQANDICIKKLKF